VTPRYRVLAVEDDLDTMQLMRVVLRDMPLDLVHAATGAEALKFLAQEAPALLVLDLNLPDMRGWELLDRLKTDQRLEVLPVVVVTSHADPVHRLIGTLQPVAAYLRKPVKPEALRQQVRTLLNL
jgi:CheY-like chemotaxis protein